MALKMNHPGTSGVNPLYKQWQKGHPINPMAPKMNHPGTSGVNRLYKQLQKGHPINPMAPKMNHPGHGHPMASHKMNHPGTFGVSQQQRQRLQGHGHLMAPNPKMSHLGACRIRRQRHRQRGTSRLQPQLQQGTK